MSRFFTFWLAAFLTFIGAVTNAQSLNLTAPQGGEEFNISSWTTIEWSPTTVFDARLEYSIDGGQTWLLIDASVDAQTNYYYWTIPATPSINCLVKISDVLNPSVFDVSDNTFTINPPSITLVYPNGGEILGVGSTHYIDWDAPGIAQVKIEYSANNGATWNTIANNYNGATGYYTWVVPNDITSEALVKISDANDPSIYDVSDFTFTIPAPYVDLMDPDGGENFPSGTNQYIIWDSESVQNVRLDYSTDGGSTWTTIVNSVPAGTQYYLWNVPNTPSTNCLVRIFDASDLSRSDMSLAEFTITGPSITVTSPNGYEIWQAGSNKYITWSSNGIASFDIAYTIDNGGTWTNIETDYTGGNYYYWNVPATYSNQCRVRVSDHADQIYFDISNDVFTIPAPSIEVDQPNGGDIWSSGTSKYIYWTSSSIQKVDLYYSTDNGSTWMLIADSVNAMTGYYYWNVPATYSNTCLLKVSETGNPSMYDISDAVWTIPAPSINVTSPNGGESWSAFTNHYIYWDAPSVAAVKIEYSADNGSSWNLIASNVNGALGYYLWNVPYTPSANCLVRVTDMASNLVYDVSDAVFTIPMPSLSLLDPNGGEVWSVGSSYYISWSSQSVSDLKIEYSTNNGVSWNIVETNAPAPQGYYYWTIPNTPSTTCLVRLTDNLNSQITAQSAAVFTIPQPAIAVTVPNGGEEWGGGSTRYIQWVSPSVQNVKIEYTLNNGSTWNTLTSSAPASAGSYQWTVPFTPSNQCKVRISDASNNTISDVSDSLFRIPQPSITVTSPNGGETWSVNTSRTITWTSNTITNVKIEYTNNNGLTWNTIVSTTSALNGYYNWNIPLAAIGNCKIRISEIGNPSVSDQSDSTFTVAGPSITLTSPTGGESWRSGSSYYITWNSNGILNVKIEYTTDNEATWTTIHPSYTNYNYYNWTVPSNINSSTCKVRVSSTLNSSLTSKSTSVFSITPVTSSITVTSPNGGETFYTGNSYYINWSSAGVNNVKIEYTLNGLVWLPVTTSTPASNGFYYWNVPATPSANARIRISDAANPNVKDESDAGFVIAVSTPSITVTSPNGGESWYAGSYHNITWNSNNIPSVDVSFSADNGNTWTIISSNVTAGFVYWYVPNTLSANCLIRISSSGLNPVTDQSDAPFSIIAIPPNNNSIVTDSVLPASFCKQDTIRVYYSANGTYNAGNIFTAQISDSLGSFAYPKVIGSAGSVSGGYITCVVPAYITNGSGFRIRVVSDDLPAVGSPAADTFALFSPVFNFSANSLIKYLPDGQVDFTYSGTAAQAYLWNFGDGDTSSVQSPSHNYKQIGYKTVSLMVTDTSGCKLTVTKPFYIRVERLMPNVNLNTNTNSDITGISFINDTVGTVVTADGNCLVTSNGGVTWNSYPTGINGVTSVTQLSSSELFITGPNGAILRSVNGGQSWNAMATSTTETLNSIAVTGNKGYAAGTNGKILLLNGSSWTSASSGTTENLSSVTIAGTGKAIVAGDNGSILRTNNSGANWNVVSTGVTNNIKQVTFADTITGYAAAENGMVLLSSDGGATWSVSLTGVDVNFSAVAVSKSGDTAWAVSNSGVIYRTTNKGQSWGRYSKGSTNDNTNATYRTSRGYITGKGGDLRTYDGGMDTTVISVRELKGFESAINLYPNPAGQQVTLEFEMEESGDVDVRVLDINGRTVIGHIANRYSGFYRKTIQTGALKPGVYFVHVRTDNNEAVLRLLIAR